MVAGYDFPETVRSDLIKRLPELLEKTDRELRDGHRGVTLLRLRVQRGEVRAIYRIIAPEGGLDYWDLLLVRSQDGCVRIGDLRTIHSGEDVSNVIRRPLLAVHEYVNRGVVGRLTGEQPLIVKHRVEVQRICDAIATKDFDTVLAIYPRLPEELRSERFLLGMRLMAAQAIDEREYAAAIDDVVRFASGDPTVNLLLVDAYVMREQLPQALECLDKFDAAIGGDPYLDFLRCKLLIAMNRLPEVQPAVARVLKSFPKDYQSHEVAAILALAERRFEHAMFELHVLETEFDYHLNLDTDPRFAEFLASPQYQTWRIQHAAPEDVSQATGFGAEALR